MSSFADAVGRRRLRRIGRRHLHEHSLIDDFDVAGSVERPNSCVGHYRLRYRSSQNVRAGSVLRGTGDELQGFVEREVAFEAVRIVLSEGGPFCASAEARKPLPTPQGPITKTFS